MSYDYKVFRCLGAVPASIEEHMMGAEPVPFESYESVKQAISKSFPGISWDDAEQTGIIENEAGRFEFQCGEDFLGLGMFSIQTSFRQGISESHDALRTLCLAESWFALDEQSMEIVG